MAIRVTQSYTSVLTQFGGDIDADANNSLALVQDEEIAEFFTILTQQLLSQNAEHNHVTRAIVERLFLQSVAGRHVDIVVEQCLGLESFCGDALQVANGLGLVDRALILTTDTADNTLGLVQTIVEVHLAENDLGFQQIVYRNFIEKLKDRLNLTQDPNTAGTEYGRDAQQVALKQHVTYVIENAPCREKAFAPFIGSSDDNEFAPPGDTAPTLVAGDGLLTYPFVSPTLSVTLKSPEFGDADNLAFQRIDVQSRGGDRLTFSDPDWPKTEILEFTIAALSEVAIDELIAFVNASMGQEIGLLDWYGQQWRGIIIAPDTTVSETAAGFSITLRFQGVQV